MTDHQTIVTTPALVHDIDHNDVQQVPHDGGVAWVATCTCGEFTCKPQGSAEDARREVYQHVRKMFRRIERGLQAQQDAGSLAGKTLRSGLQAIVDAPGTVTKARLIALLAAYPE